MKLDSNISLRYNPISDTLVGYYGCLEDSEAEFRGINLGSDEDMTVEIIKVGSEWRISGFHMISVGAHPEWSLFLSEWFSNSSMEVLVDALHKAQKEAENLDLFDKMWAFRKEIRILDLPPIFERIAPSGAPV